MDIAGYSEMVGAMQPQMNRLQLLAAVLQKHRADCRWVSDQQFSQGTIPIQIRLISPVQLHLK